MSMFVVAPAATYHPNPNHHHESLNLSADQLGVGVGVIPLLTAAPVLPPPQPQNVDDVRDLLSSRGNKLNIGGLHQFWQNQSNPSPSIYSTKHMNNSNANNCNNNTLLLQGGNGHGNNCGGGPNGNTGQSSGGGTSTCQDCGNQAKKDCSHGRCRTCCKSRGFDCVTHVKSTWVPASRRRERQLLAGAGVASGSGGGNGGGGGDGSSGSTSHGVKKPRLISSQATTSHTSTSNNTATPPRSFDTSSSHQDASFKESLPGEVRAPAVFKCVRVTGMMDGEDEYAYQAVVKIGGHVFKGFLYDQGVESRDIFPNLSELHLGGGGGRGGGGNARNGQSSSSPIIVPSDVYGATGGGLLGGSSYGNPMS